MTVLTIRHTYTDGTTVEGTEKNDAAHLALKAHGSWGWAHSAEAWLLKSSRNRLPKPGAIKDVERVLTELGYTVERDIDDTMPSVAEQEADFADRSDRRADRHGSRAERTQADADAAHKKGWDVLSQIPFGQPLLPGHHSYPADKNRREKAVRSIDKSIELGREADDLARRADTAERAVGARNNPVTVANRIKTMEADQRRLKRELDGPLGWRKDGTFGPCHPTHERAEWLATQLAELDKQITYWHEVYAEMQAQGKASTYGPDNVAVGDWVRACGIWAPVRRVNKKTVTVPNPNFRAPLPGHKERRTTVDWSKVSDHCKAGDVPDGVVDEYEGRGS